MTRDEVLQTTIKIIKDCTPPLADAEINEDSVVNTDMGVDSMGFILIMCKLEAAFNVKIPQRQWNKLTSLREVVDAFYTRMENNE